MAEAMKQNLPSDEEERERLLLAYSPKFKSIMHVAERQVREGKGIKHDDF